MKKNLFLRVITLMLVLVTAIAALSSCSVRKVPSGKLALTPVGTVNGNEVLYDELYYLSANYLPSITEEYGSNTEEAANALKSTVYENILTNYAILALCDEMGVTADDSELKEDIQAEIDSIVETECNGSRKSYRDMLKSESMTDRYMRQTVRTDLLYSKLPAKYLANGLIPSTESELKEYAEKNVIRTQHIAVLVENGETREENLAKAEEALEKYKNGEISFHKLIGSKYNEDLSPMTTTNGYYSALGSSDKAYEDAAIALEINGVSEIVESVGQSNVTGKTVPCFYIIQRLAIDEQYISENLSDVQDKAANAEIAKKLEAKKAELVFEPNEFGASLDLTSLDYPKDGFDAVVFFTVLGCVAVAGGIAAIVFFFESRRRKRIAARRALKQKNN